MPPLDIERPRRVGLVVRLEHDVFLERVLNMSQKRGRGRSEKGGIAAVLWRQGGLLADPGLQAGLDIRAALVSRRRARGARRVPPGRCNSCRQ